jgi:hypothetical protein
MDGPRITPTGRSAISAERVNDIGGKLGREPLSLTLCLRMCWVEDRREHAALSVSH